MTKKNKHLHGNPSEAFASGQMSKREMKRLLRKKHREPMEGTPFVASVSTSVGNIIIPSTSMVYVSVYRGQYIRKPVSELKPGEMAVFRKEGIDLDLESDVEPILIQSPRYRATLPHLFDLDGPTPVTRFSRELGKGVDGDMAERVAKAIVETSAERMDAAASAIQAILAARCISRSIGHIKNGWLGGKTVAPRDFPQIFEALGAEMPSTGLSALAGSEEFARQYRLHMTLRQAIMRNLSLIIAGKGKGPAGTPEDKHDSGIDTHPELKMVVEHFAQQIDDAFATIRIFGVKKANGDSGLEGGQLYKGLVTEETDQFGTDGDMKEFFSMCSVLNGINYRVLDEYIFRNPEITKGLPVLETRTRLEELLLLFLSERMGHEAVSQENLQDRAISRKIMAARYHEIGDGPEIRALREASGRILAVLESGTLDRQHGLPHGTLHSLIDTCLRLHASKPEIFHYYNYLTKLQLVLARGEPYGRKIIFADELERELNRVEDKIRARYGEEFLKDTLVSPHTLGVAAHAFGITTDRFYEKYYNGEIPDEAFPSLLTNLLGTVLPAVTIRTHPDWRERALATLRKMGFGNCARLYPGLVGEPDELLG
ncbi:MAG: hypothetical protein PHY95_04350 [Candidatus ainarchaeum sp.]|nr:hypothetical protein [Candidatus ainarchaeum sp.]